MKKSTLFFLLSILCLTGCVSYWNGTLSSNLQLSPEHYNLIGQAEGKAKTFVLFGFIGGNEHSNLVNEAKGDLIRSYPLDSNMYFGDWSVSFQTKYRLYCVEQICRVKAGIFSLSKTSKPYERFFPIELNPTPNLKMEPEEFKIGDRVMFFLGGQKTEGTILKLDGSTLKISYLDSESILRKVNRFKHEVKRLK